MEWLLLIGGLLLAGYGWLSLAYTSRWRDETLVVVTLIGLIAFWVGFVLVVGTWLSSTEKPLNRHVGSGFMVSGETHREQP